jgi:hypothetical protein
VEGFMGTMVGDCGLDDLHSKVGFSDLFPLPKAIAT